MATSLTNGTLPYNLAITGTLMSLKSFGIKKTFKILLTLGQPKTGKLVGIDSR
jgi:hypothetical protein